MPWATVLRLLRKRVQRLTWKVPFGALFLLELCIDLFGSLGAHEDLPQLSANLYR